ncbi:MAG: hypothetical protein MZW92_81855 [Comamonadaceae bacterium]|nr:hypothetical protein [Comamonadaceae bacterium]
MPPMRACSAAPATIQIGLHLLVTNGAHECVLGLRQQPLGAFDGLAHRLHLGSIERRRQRREGLIDPIERSAGTAWPGPRVAPRWIGAPPRSPPRSPFVLLRLAAARARPELRVLPTMAANAALA